MFLLLATAAQASPTSLEQRAREALVSTGLGEVALARVVPLGGAAGPRGAVVQLQPVIDGIPVDRLGTVRFDASGQIRRVRDVPLPTRRISGTAIAADRAIAVARQTVGGSRPRARLSWQVTGDVLRRVWTIELDGAPPGPVAPRVVVDAVSGGVLSVTDAAEIDAPLALVYVEDPLAEAAPTVVELPLATVSLSDDRVEVLQCRDQGEVQTWTFEDDATLDVHVCTRVPAAGPVDGDYLYEPVPYPSDPARDEDDFAAPQVYWNVHRGLDWFEALGWVPAEGFDPRLLLTVNQRNTDFWSAETTSDPAAALLPYDNAYSTGGYLDYEDVWVPPALVFGQGTTVDFAYDASVIHHELGHFVVKSQNGPSWSENTSYGTSTRANALNEGLADYFSAALHEEALLGEYVLEGGIRDLAGDTTCASDLVGEPHYDSLPFSQGLWAFRASLPEADRSTLDTVVLDSLAVMGLNPDFPDAAGEIEALVAERLGAPRQAELAASWEARGVHDCAPVVDIVPGEEPFVRYGLLRGSYEYSTLGEVPGELQFRVQVPEGGARLTLRLDQSQYLGLDPYERNVVQPIVVVGRSADRLSWTREEREITVTFDGDSFTVIVDEWVSDGEEVATTGEVAVAPSETNPQYEIHTHEAVWDVETAGTYVFQLANGYDRQAVAYWPILTLSALPPEETEPAPVDVPEGESHPMGEYPADRETASAGCGCASSGAGPAWMLGLAGLGLVLRRRRQG